MTTAFADHDLEKIATEGTTNLRYARAIAKELLDLRRSREAQPVPPSDTNREVQVTNGEHRVQVTLDEDYLRGLISGSSPNAALLAQELLEHRQRANGQTAEASPHTGQVRFDTYVPVNDDFLRLFIAGQNGSSPLRWVAQELLDRRLRDQSSVPQKGDPYPQASTNGHRQAQHDPGCPLGRYRAEFLPLDSALLFGAVRNIRAQGYVLVCGLLINGADVCLLFARQAERPKTTQEQFAELMDSLKREQAA